MEALEVALLWQMKEYVLWLKATIVEYIVNHPINKLFTEDERMLVSSRFMRWWYYDINQEEEGDSASEGEEVRWGDTEKIVA